METLGDIIKRSRKLKKMTLVQLGEETELSHGYLSNLENNNRNNPSSEVLKKIADVLEIPHSELLAAAGHLDKRTLYEELTLELDKNNRDLAQTRQELSFLARKIEEQSKKNTKDTDFLQYISEQKFREDILSNLQHKSYELEVKLYELKEELAAVGHLDKRALYKELTLEFEKNDMDLEQTEQELAYLARKIEEQSETSTKDEVFLDNLTEESNLKKRLSSLQVNREILMVRLHELKEEESGEVIQPSPITFTSENMSSYMKNKIKNSLDIILSLNDEVYFNGKLLSMYQRKQLIQIAEILFKEETEEEKE